jgi:signal transduction histidine kinase
MDMVSVNDALSSVERLIAPQLRAKSLGLDSPVCSNTLMVHADPDKLQQVLLNLLANAVKFTPTGGEVSVAIDESQDAVSIVVRDTGPGIPPARLGTIFDPFDQGERKLNKPQDGVGLGLAIARDLARGMGGDITVASELGKGSVFTVTLRRARLGVPSLPTSASGAPTAAR